MRGRAVLGACVACAGTCGGANGQIGLLISDRTNDAVWRVGDTNNNGLIEEPGEVRLWFSAVNAAGTTGPSNPSCLATHADGTAILGDQGLGAILRLRDTSGDGDAQDAGESALVADGTNASLMSLAFPTGAAFDNQSSLYIVNAGNSFGPDAIYRLTDQNADGDYQDSGEIALYVGAGAFGPGNGPFSPQETAFVPAVIPIGLLRNSSAGLHGVYRFVDISGNGRADDPGEFITFFDGTNASGIALSAGFGLDNDASRPGSAYMLQTAANSLDQLIRLTDKDGNLTAQEAGEAVVAWETSEADFINIDLLSLTDGRVLVTDSDLDRIVLLTDTDGDGRFVTPGERTNFFVNGSALLGDLRQIAPIAVPAGCYPDCNQSGTLTIADFACFQSAFAGGSPYADCTGSGGLTIADFACFQAGFVAGCP